MSGFSAAWLALREPRDLRARNHAVLAALAAWARPRGRVTLLDLGCGTGATVRAVAPHLGADQHWILVDDDAALLERIGPELTDWARGHHGGDPANGLVVDGEGHRATIEVRQQDLAAGPPEPTGVDAVTASALFDLVSAAWADVLAGQCVAAAVPLYAALTFDGRIAWQPAVPLDRTVARLMARHQRTDKGFGPALGPAAADHLTAAFAAAGWSVARGRSDWRFGPADRTIQAALVEDWASADAAIVPQVRVAVAGWRDRRRAVIARGQSRLRVGNVDLLALPPDLPG